MYEGGNNKFEYKHHKMLKTSTIILDRNNFTLPITKCKNRHEYSLKAALSTIVAVSSNTKRKEIYGSL